MSVYHRNCLTQIEIFRFIGIHFASDGGCELRIQACAPASTMAPGKGAITAPHLPLPDHVRHFALVFLLGLLSLKLGFAQEGNQSSPKNAGCHVEAVDYKGWQAQQVSNRWVQLIIVPQNGGRLMQVSFNGHAYLFVNPKLAGKYMPPSQDQWFNYGGDKLWLLPEGDDDEQHWRGNSDLLDDGPFTFRKLSDGQGCGIELTGPPDPHTGIKFSRTIRRDPDSPHITFRAS